MALPQHPPLDEAPRLGQRVRNHPIDGAIVAPAAAFLLVAGFSAELTGVLAAVQFFIGLFAHANVRWRLRPLHRIVLTPEFHHWHHANEPEAIFTNYSVFLPIWDQLFGTYRMPRDQRPTVYGVSEYVPSGFVAQLAHPVPWSAQPAGVGASPRPVDAGDVRVCPSGPARDGPLDPAAADGFVHCLRWTGRGHAPAGPQGGAGARPAASGRRGGRRPGRCGGQRR